MFPPARRAAQVTRKKALDVLESGLKFQAKLEVEQVTEVFCHLMPGILVTSNGGKYGVICQVVGQALLLGLRRAAYLSGSECKLPKIAVLGLRSNALPLTYGSHTVSGGRSRAACERGTKNESRKHTLIDSQCACLPCPPQSRYSFSMPPLLLWSNLLFRPCDAHFCCPFLL